MTPPDEQALRTENDLLRGVVSWALGDTGEIPYPPKQPKWWRRELRHRLSAIPAQVREMNAASVPSESA